MTKLMQYYDFSLASYFLFWCQIFNISLFFSSKLPHDSLITIVSSNISKSQLDK